MRKILGSIFVLLIVLSLVGSIGNGTFMADEGFFGTLLVWMLFALSAVFLFAFDGACHTDYITGIRKRKTQGTLSLLFVLVYTLLMAIAVFVTMSNSFGDFTETMLASAVASLPYIFGMGVFICMYTYYNAPCNACRRNFGYSAEWLSHYLADPRYLQNVCPNGTVLAGSDILFFPKLFCLIPIGEIASVKEINQLVERDVVFTLKNGKKITVVSRQYEYIRAYLAQFGIN